MILHLKLVGISFTKQESAKKIGKKTYYSAFSKPKRIYAKYLIPKYTTSVIEKDDNYAILKITSDKFNYTTDLIWRTSDEYKICWSLNENHYDEELEEEKNTSKFATLKAGKTIYVKLTFKKQLSSYKNDTLYILNTNYKGKYKTNNWNTPYGCQFQYKPKKDQISFVNLCYVG